MRSGNGKPADIVTSEEFHIVDVLYISALMQTKTTGIHRYVFNAYKPTILPADKIFIPLSFVSTTPPTQGDRGTGAYLTVATW